MSDFVMNAVLNNVSTVFGKNYFAAACGCAVQREIFYFGLTFEKDATKIKKLRVFLCQEDLLKSISGMTQPGLEMGEHKLRWDTLQIMAKIYGDPGNLGPNLPCPLALMHKLFIPAFKLYIYRSLQQPEHTRAAAKAGNLPLILIFLPRKAPDHDQA